MREVAILNNDNTSFVVFDKEDDSKTLTRTPALEHIVKNSVNIKKNRKRTLGAWGHPAKTKLFNDNGNNIMVFNKLIKNVYVRWDADLGDLRHIFGWSKSPLLLDETPENTESRKEELMSEIVICYK